MTREKFPDRPITVCGDDDHENPDNPGRTKAEAASRTAGARLAIPVFQIPEGKSDFNDLAQAEGLEPELTDAAQAGRLDTTRLCRLFWQRAAEDRLVDPALDLPHLTTATDLLVCADSVVHLRRSGVWSARSHRRLVVESLTALAQPAR